MTIKQVIVMRTDTNPPMRKGKMVAQGAHASMAFLSKLTMAGRKPTEIQQLWMNESFRKICVRVDSLEEFHAIAEAARKAGIETHVIKDSGMTEFKEPTYTAIGIGPDYDEKIDKITGHLKLL